MQTCRPMTPRWYICVLTVLVGCGLRTDASTPLTAQDDKKPAANEKLIELEKKLLTVPADIKDRDEWQKAWCERLIISLSRTGGMFSKVNGFSIENKTPWVLKLDKGGWDGFTRNGAKVAKGKDDGEWHVKPSQKLLVASQARVLVSPLVFKKNAQFIALFSAHGICRIEVQPKYTDLEPIELLVVGTYGEDVNGKVVTGKFLVCKPGEFDKVRRLLD